MTVATGNPCATFAVLAYNQERFVAEAVSGALGQQCEALEILLSDDCSTDSTFEVMESMAAAYKGPHRVRTNRNATNLGIGGHINRVMELAQGDLVVAAAGDDFSVPERTRLSVEAWLRGGRRHAAVTARAAVIDERGCVLGELGGREVGFSDIPEMMVRAQAPMAGCTLVWHRRVFEEFGPLLPDTVCEDQAIAFRAILMGGIAYVDKVLVRYRRHPAAVSYIDDDADAETILAERIRESKWGEMTLRNLRRDLTTLVMRRPERSLQRLEKEAADGCERFRRRAEFLQSSRWGRLRTIADFATPVSWGQRLRWLVMALVPFTFVAAERLGKLRGRRSMLRAVSAARRRPTEEREA